MGLTQNWKAAEKSWANDLQKCKVPAKRVSRGSDYSVSTFDVKIGEREDIISDSKYSMKKPFRHHSLLRTIKSKYSKDKKDIVLLYTKNYKEHGGVISMDSMLAAKLLAYWLGYADKEFLETLE